MVKKRSVYLLLWWVSTLASHSQANEDPPRRIVPAQSTRQTVAGDVMQQIYSEIKTPYKYGVVLKGEGDTKVDCPSVFRYRDHWYMTYIMFDGRGYETAIARSSDLLSWKTLGKILSNRPGRWDGKQTAGYIALQDFTWGGSCELQKYDGKYWLSYIGGALAGYETAPLAIGVAWVDDPSKPSEWNRLDRPVLARDQSDVRDFEKYTLYKSTIIEDKTRALGYRFVMFYNAKGAKRSRGYERIGMAVSNDMTRWLRYGASPVVDNGNGISGDPQIARIDDVWVMFYFGAFFRPKAFDSFACSYDLVHWTKWTGPDLVAPSEPWDKTFAHKPWVIKHDDTVYHFYCAVGDQGRVIALATSKDLRGATRP